MAGVYCAHCKSDVILEHDGTCSNCRAPLIATPRPTAAAAAKKPAAKK